MSAFNPAQSIARKRDGHCLTDQEIGVFVAAFARGEIPDYQMSAMAMAICIRGMTAGETAALTYEMLRSGQTLQWSSSLLPKVDKHSTGGIGDKVSLVLAPLLACCGLQVPMISGRGLGVTGGTLDKLESIAGLRTDLNCRELCDQVERIGCAITGATSDVAPADKKLYALRDVTATVESIPLITASILSKKLAENLDVLVLDVKFGSGAFMRSLDEARKLAKSLVETAALMGVKATALLTDMNQPAGRMVGNAVEVNEAVDAIRGAGPADLRELVLSLGAEILQLAGVSTGHASAQSTLIDHLESGRAADKFAELVDAQGGDLSAPRPVAPSSEIVAEDSGYVTEIDGGALGLAVIELGGGRKRQNDAIDRSVGLEMLVRLGTPVQQSAPLVRVFAEPSVVEGVRDMIGRAFRIEDSRPALKPLIADRLASTDL